MKMPTWEGLYLPQEFLKHVDSVDPAGVLREPCEVWPAVIKLLDEADKRYRDGEKGIRYLPFRAAIAAFSARYIYAAIGDKIRKLGPSYVRQRTVISFRAKLYYIFKASLMVFSQIPWRLVRPFAAVILVWNGDICESNYRSLSRCDL